jgi:hypothetical protein
MATVKAKGHWLGCLEQKGRMKKFPNDRMTDKTPVLLVHTKPEPVFLRLITGDQLIATPSAKPPQDCLRPEENLPFST